MVSNNTVIYLGMRSCGCTLAFVGKLVVKTSELIWISKEEEWEEQEQERKKKKKRQKEQKDCT